MLKDNVSLTTAVRLHITCLPLTDFFAEKTTMDKKKSQTRNDHLEFQSSLLSATISDKNKTDEKESNELGPSKGRPNTQLATSLGKVHLTKRM